MEYKSNINSKRNLSDYFKSSLKSDLKKSVKSIKGEKKNYFEKPMRYSLKKKNSDMNQVNSYKMGSPKNNAAGIETIASQSINKYLSCNTPKPIMKTVSIKSTFKSSSGAIQKKKFLSFFDQDTFSMVTISRKYKKVPNACACIDLFFKNIHDEKDFASFLQKDIIRSLRISCLYTMGIAIIKTIINATLFSETFYFVNEDNEIQILTVARFSFLPLCICLLYASTYIPKLLPHLEVITSIIFTLMNLSYLFILCACNQFNGASTTESICESSYLLEFSYVLQLFILYIALVLFIPIRAVYLWPICSTAPIAFNINIALNNVRGQLIYSSFSQGFYIMIFSTIAMLGKRVLERKTRFQYINIRHIMQKDELYKQATSEINCSNAYDEVNFYLNSTLLKINSVIKFLMFKSNDLYEILLNARTDIEKCILKLSKLDNLLTVDKDALLSNLKENNMIIEHLFNTIYTKKHDHEIIPESEISKRPPLCIDEIIKKYRNNGKINIESYETIQQFEATLVEEQKNQKHKISVNTWFKINLFKETDTENRELNKKNHKKYVAIIKKTNMLLKNKLDGLGENWNFNMFTLQNSLKENTFIGVGMYFLDNYFESIKCPNYLAYNFLYDIKEAYLSSNKYHNSLHGADVCQTMLCILNNMNVFKKLDYYTQISVIIATLCHDVGHPGVTNSFLIKTHHNLSVHYNDMYVLENYHSALTFFYLKKESNNFLANFSESEFTVIRQIIIDLILATDLANHFEFLSIIKIRSRVEDFSILKNDSDNINFLKLCIKAADISHTCKPFNIHLLCVINLMMESYQQGEKEKMYNIPVLPFYDFEQVDKLPESQIGFISFICNDIFLELLHIERLLKKCHSGYEIKRRKTEFEENAEEKTMDTLNEKKSGLNTLKCQNINDIIIHNSEDGLYVEKEACNHSFQKVDSGNKCDMFIYKYCLHHLNYNSHKWETDKNLVDVIKQYMNGEITDDHILKMT